MSQQGSVGRRGTSTGSSGGVSSLSVSDSEVISPDSGGDIRFTGSDGISITGNQSENSLNISGTSSSQATSKYIVDPDGTGSHTTLQAAITAANGQPVFIRAGTYNENLTFTSNTILVGATETTVRISGVHNLTGCNFFEARYCIFHTDSSDVNFNLGNGTNRITFYFKSCDFEGRNTSANKKYVFGTTNRPINMEMKLCELGGGTTTQPATGIINASNQSSFFFFRECYLGTRQNAEHNLTGLIFIVNSHMFGALNATISRSNFGADNTNFQGTTVTINTTAPGAGISINNCTFDEGTGNCLTLNGTLHSTRSLYISSCEFDATRAPIVGNISGAISLSGNTFSSNSTINLPNGNIVGGTSYASTLKTDYRGVLVGQGAQSDVLAEQLTDGQLLIGSTNNAPNPSTLTAGRGVNITNTPGEVTIASDGVATLQGVTPDENGNIQFRSSPNVSILGINRDHTIAVTVDKPHSVDYLTGNDGTRVEADNVTKNINIRGEHGINITGDNDNATLTVSGSSLGGLDSINDVAGDSDGNITLEGTGSVTVQRSANPNAITIRGTAETGVATVQGNSGGAISPRNGNIIVSGTNGIVVEGHPSTSSLNISGASLGGLDSLTPSSGSAVRPDSHGNINITAQDGISTTGDAATNTLSIGSSAVRTITGNTGDAISGDETNRNINIRGSGGVTVAGSGSTLTVTGTQYGDLHAIRGNTGGDVTANSSRVLQLVGTGSVSVAGDPENNRLTISSSATGGTTAYGLTKFIVGSEGNAPYQTIQAAVNAARLAGGGLVFIQPGRYVENLTFQENCHIKGAGRDLVFIQGRHNLTLTESISISDITFQANNQDILGFTSYNQPLIGGIHNCTFNISDTVAQRPKYALHNVDRVGDLLFESCDVIGSRNALIQGLSHSMKITCRSCRLSTHHEAINLFRGATFIDNCKGEGTFNFGDEATGSRTRFEVYHSEINKADIRTNALSSGIIQNCVITEGAGLPLFTYRGDVQTEISIADCTINATGFPPLSGNGNGRLVLGNNSYTNRSDTSFSGNPTLVSGKHFSGAYISNYTNNGILLGGGTRGDIKATTALGNGQVLLGRANNAPVAANLTAGTGINITNASGRVTIANATVNPIVQDTSERFTMAAATDYIISNRALVNVFLPASGIPVNSYIKVICMNRLGFTINTQVSQIISGAGGATSSPRGRLTITSTDSDSTPGCVLRCFRGTGTMAREFFLESAQGTVVYA